jgi:hypothetical protein
MDAARRNAAEKRPDIAAVCDTSSVAKEKPTDHSRRERFRGHAPDRRKSAREAGRSQSTPNDAEIHH